MDSASAISLIELNLLIKETLTKELKPAYWVIAEISELHEARTGHCYLELIQKDEFSELPIAKSRAVIWAGAFRMIKPYFENATGQMFQNGIKVLVKVGVNFHEMYGLSLVITDIEPAFTLGDLELKRKEVIKQLHTQGIFDLNKQLQLPLLVQRIAVISSPTAAGYEDFINQLNSNKSRLVFYTCLFPAHMQGESAAQSIIMALDKVYENISLFDVVVIIRGGGSKTDLLCFDNFDLSSNICQFPIPIFSGIGHERDVSVVDLVSHSSKKTPTAVAEYLIELMEQSVLNYQDASDFIVSTVQDLLEEAKYNAENISIKLTRFATSILNYNKRKLVSLSSTFKFAGKSVFDKNKTKYSYLINSLVRNTSLTIRNNKGFVEQLKDYSFTHSTKVLNHQMQIIQGFQNQVNIMKPDNILKKGFSITRLNGKAVSAQNLPLSGNEIETQIQDNKIVSIVK